MNVFPVFAVRLSPKDFPVKISEAQVRSEKKTRNAAPLNGDVMKQKKKNTYFMT